MLATDHCPLKKATLIYNPIAGRNPRKREKEVRDAQSVLQRQGILATLAPTLGPNSARGLARMLTAQGEDFIIVCGGDGTINEVINGIAPGGATLGILPGGTANIFAKELGLPHDPVRAANELPGWSSRRIALGRATWTESSGGAPEQRFFLSLAGVGFDAYVVHRLSPGFKMAWGVVSYVAEAFRQALRYPFPSFVCELDGRSLPATFATVQRTRRYAGWLHLAPRANIFEPQFSLCIFKSRHWARYLLYALAVVTRLHRRLADVEMLQTQKIVCDSAAASGPVYFELDGELVGKLPATFEIVADALTVLVPCKNVDGTQ
jgi:diacylglycerol kinase (ATP)